MDLCRASALEPEICDVPVIRPCLKVAQELGQRELTLTGADRINIALDRVLWIDDWMDTAPHQEGSRIDFPDAPCECLRQIGVAGHTGECHQISARESLCDLIDVFTSKAPRFAHCARYQFRER